MQELMTQDQRERLLSNGRLNAARIAKDGGTLNFFPYRETVHATGLLSELDPASPSLPSASAISGLAHSS